MIRPARSRRHPLRRRAFESAARGTRNAFRRQDAKEAVAVFGITFGITSGAPMRRFYPRHSAVSAGRVVVQALRLLDALSGG